MRNSGSGSCSTPFVLARRGESSAHIQQPDLCAYEIILRGRVQGFGVRPAIARLAQKLCLCGVVGNRNDGVRVCVEGSRCKIEEFLDYLVAVLPAAIQLVNCQVAEMECSGWNSFTIDSTTSHGPPSVLVPPDIATCHECFMEVADDRSRRHDFLFTTCTCCGPRYSIVDAMPYDRELTSMASFRQCPQCRNEYSSVSDRRFHSQTNSCTACGPKLWGSDGSGNVAYDQALVLRRAVDLLRQGKILAIKGIGGYQLMTNATSSIAVDKLRRRKQRFGKPFAVMVGNLQTAETLAVLGPAERTALRSAGNPIVVANLRAPSALAPSIPEGLATIGLMLPSSPLHELLAMRAGCPLVVTSGNVEGDPLIYDPIVADSELRSVADFMLHHDRPIIRPIDDSVVQVVAAAPSTIRLARGLAPLHLELETEHCLLALGAHHKVAIALTNGVQAVLGPHLGDLDDESTRARYLSHLDAMCRLYNSQPQLLIHDSHPDYFTTRWAAEQPIATLAVQHHHAHVVSGMLEHRWLDREVLGVGWDGTGFGPDGTIWGGEFLVATATGFRRVAHFRPFALPGGDVATHQPWRVAAALVCQTLGPDAVSRLSFPDVKATAIGDILRIVNNNKLCPQSSSAGRLFDAVAALALGVTKSQFEGQPAMLLEAACDLSASGEYDMPLIEGSPIILDWRPLICGVLRDSNGGVTPAAIAMKFHRALASAIISVASRYHHLPVVLAGGCFHNRVLAELVAQQFQGRRQLLGMPGAIPTNDGGLAAGQLAVAIARLRQGELLCV